MQILNSFKEKKSLPHYWKKPIYTSPQFILLQVYKCL